MGVPIREGFPGHRALPDNVYRISDIYYGISFRLSRFGFFL